MINLTRQIPNCGIFLEHNESPMTGPSWNSWSLALSEHALIRDRPDPSVTLDL